MFHNKEGQLDNCGCVYKNGPQEKHGKIVYTPRTLISECFSHKKQRLEKLRIKQELKNFPNYNSGKIYKMLDRMMDELFDLGVGVIHLSDNDKMILKKYAIKIDRHYKPQ